MPPWFENVTRRSNAVVTRSDLLIRSHASPSNSAFGEHVISYVSTAKYSSTFATKTTVMSSFKKTSHAISPIPKTLESKCQVKVFHVLLIISQMGKGTSVTMLSLTNRSYNRYCNSSKSCRLATVILVRLLLFREHSNGPRGHEPDSSKSCVAVLLANLELFITATRIAGWFSRISELLYPLPLRGPGQFYLANLESIDNARYILRTNISYSISLLHARWITMFSRHYFKLVFTGKTFDLSNLSTSNTSKVSFIETKNA